MSSIPEELYHEILLRLPVKSTFVCKCVSKAWYQLISDPDFVKSHLDFTISKNKPNLMLSDGHRVYTIGHDSLDAANLSTTCDFDAYASEMDSPISDGIDSTLELLGSCNGLVLLCSCDGLCYCLWNPATTEYIKISYAPDLYDPDLFKINAFGYDYKTDDYKLIAGEDIKGDAYCSLVQVYTLRSNSWKSTLTVPYRFCGDEGVGGVLVNGDIHWLAKVQDNSVVVVSFDISEEIFLDLQLPKEPLKNRCSFRSVGVLEGCLCVLVGVTHVHFEVWVMQDYGVHESWTKRFVANNERFREGIFSMRFICSFKSGEILFGVTGNHDGNIVLYDPKNRSVMEPNIPTDWSLFTERFYFETLVSLN